MIITNCSNVIDAFTHCEHLAAIYTYGSLVWPIGCGSWYVSWTPSNVSGSFTMFGSTYRLEDYSGYYSWNGNSSSGVIPSSAFISNRLVRMATNVSCINTNAFQDCSTLRYVSIPNCTYIQSGAFMGCNLSYLSFPLGEHIESAAFASCYNMSSIFLDYNSVCRLDSSDAFQDTYITPYTGSIIVPFSLLDSYKTDSVWSYFFTIIYPYIPINSYYIKWTPSVANGHLTLYSPTSTYHPIVSTDLSSWTAGYIIFSSYYSSMYAQLESANITTFETNVTIFGKYAALKNISTLTYVNFYECSSIAWQAFMNCSNLSYANIPNVTCVEEATFLNDINLEYVNAVGCTVVEEQAFQNCKKLTSISLPNCSMISGWAFNSCHSLSMVSIPNCEQILNFAFADCSSLSEINLPKVSYISMGAFQFCQRFSKITLRSTSVVYIEESGVFYKTPIYSGNGNIYVPSSLVSSYKTNARWSYFSSRIFPIPE